MRDATIEQVTSALGDSRLVWFGTRGSDARPLLAYKQLSAVFSIVSPLALPLGPIEESCLESLSQHRVDLNAYTIDSDHSTHASTLYRAMTESFVGPTTLAAYRPCDFLAAACYARLDRVRYLGLFHGIQSAFDHKAWVEIELGKRGVPILPWRYYANQDLPGLERDFRRVPFVLRANFSDGGRGFSLVHSGEDWRQHLPPHVDHFIAAAPYLSDSVPVNVGACVFPDGTHTFHGPSVQLVGNPLCTSNPFAYCGNDFASVAGELGIAGANQLQATVASAASWLHSMGYRGAFGIDALWHEGQMLLLEINPRFQGSSAPSATIDESLDRPDIFTMHLAAHLEVAPSVARVSLWELCLEQSKPRLALSNVVCHNTRNTAVERVAPPPPSDDEIMCLPGEKVSVAPEAILFRLETHRPAFDRRAVLLPEVTSVVKEVRECFAECDGANLPE